MQGYTTTTTKNYTAPALLVLAAFLILSALPFVSMPQSGWALRVGEYQVTIGGKQGAEAIAATAEQPAALEATTDMERIVFAAADEFGVSRALAAALLQQESGGNPTSTSPVGAAGLLQVMPATAAGIAQELGVGSYDIYDPATNARFGMYYLSQKLQRYGHDWGLAAYNWGPNAVDSFLERHPDAAQATWETITTQWGGEIPIETQNYVRSISAIEQRRLALALMPPQKKCPITQPTMQINAHFTDTNSPYWAGQIGGMHNGVDIGGDPGTPVYAPFDLVVEDIQYYGDAGRIGWYVQGRFTDGYLFYAGHLGTTSVQVGQSVPACTQIGTIGEVFHTHIKIAPQAAPVPCEPYARPNGSPWCEDFLTYFEQH